MAAENGKTFYDRIIDGIKNHRISAVTILVGVLFISIGSLTDAIDKILSFKTKYCTKTEPATPKQAMPEADIKKPDLAKSSVDFGANRESIVKIVPQYYILTSSPVQWDELKYLMQHDSNAAGYSVPTVQELRLLVGHLNDYDFQKNYFWSSNTKENKSYIVNLASGDVEISDKGALNCVVLVRH